jgi:hypothetical protein
VTGRPAVALRWRESNDRRRFCHVFGSDVDRRARRIERYLGGDRFGKFSRFALTDAVHRDHAEHVLSSLDQFRRFQVQRLRVRFSLADERRLLDVASLDDVLGDRFTSVALRDVPLEVHEVFVEGGHQEVPRGRWFVCKEILTLV